jgi:hypothetical protein
LEEISETWILYFFSTECYNVMNRVWVRAALSAVTYLPSARQRFAKNVPAETDSCTDVSGQCVQQYAAITDIWCWVSDQ